MAAAARASERVSGLVGLSQVRAPQPYRGDPPPPREVSLTERRDISEHPTLASRGLPHIKLRFCRLSPTVSVKVCPAAVCRLSGRHLAISFKVFGTGFRKQSRGRRKGLKNKPFPSASPHCYPLSYPFPFPPPCMVTRPLLRFLNKIHRIQTQRYT